jgi:hypothetical protein
LFSSIQVKKVPVYFVVFIFLRTEKCHFSFSQDLRMLQKRYFGTTAGEIARLVPMFEMTRRGLQDAIAVLRGRK